MNEEKINYPLLKLDMNGRYIIHEEEGKCISFTNKKCFEKFLEENKEKLTIKVFKRKSRNQESSDFLLSELKTQ